MNKTIRNFVSAALCAALLVPATASARPHCGPRHHGGPRPCGPAFHHGPRHHVHHSWHGGDWAAFGAVVGLGALAVAAVADTPPPPPPPTYQSVTYTTTQPVVVQSAPAVVAEPAASTTVVQQPVATTTVVQQPVTTTTVVYQPAPYIHVAPPPPCRPHFRSGVWFGF